jgi:hypothetical protein
MAGLARVTLAAALVAMLGPGCDTGAVETVDAPSGELPVAG